MVFVCLVYGMLLWYMLFSKLIRERNEGFVDFESVKLCNLFNVKLCFFKLLNIFLVIFGLMLGNNLSIWKVDILCLGLFV